MMKISFKKADDSILDELIGKCEEAMVNPFKKKKEMTVAGNTDAEPEDAKESEDQEDLESEEEDSLSAEDLEKLLQVYKELKDK
jgi:ribosomal protein L12E/L44/L45/RPP1/RPP2